MWKNAFSLALKRMIFALYMCVRTSVNITSLVSSSCEASGRFVHRFTAELSVEPIKKSLEGKVYALIKKNIFRCVCKCVKMYVYMYMGMCILLWVSRRCWPISFLFIVNIFLSSFFLEFFFLFFFFFINILSTCVCRESQRCPALQGIIILNMYQVSQIFLYKLI